MLKFQWPSHSKELRFGDVPIPESYIIADYVPAVPTIVGVASATTDADLIDAFGCSVYAHQQSGEDVYSCISITETQAEKLAAITETDHSTAVIVVDRLSSLSQQMLYSSSGAASDSQTALPVYSSIFTASQDSEKVRNGADFAAQQTEKVYTAFTAQQTETNKIRPRLKLNQQHGVKIHRRLHIDHHHGRLVDVRLFLSDESAIPPDNGYWPFHPIPPEPQPNPNGEKIDLVFCKPKGKKLYFGRPSIYTDLANREAYIVSNTFSLKRVSDDAEIECSNFNASIDVDSWCWSWSASIPAAQQSLIEPVDGDPVEVVATINGNPLRLMVERMSRERKFPDAWLSIGGRGRSAWLAEPYDYQRSYDNAAALRTANQLAEEALEENSVPIGWAVDWQIDDWDVPAGAWRATGTHIDAVIKIADAAGAYVQADDVEKTLHILPKYPAMPRDWAGLTADHSLPEDICETESVEWVDKAEYNAVWVVGGADGRKDKIVLTGSAGDKPAQTVVDDLMTDSEVTRQKGLSILADTGRQAGVTIRLPVLPEIGLVKVGKIVDYTERGITRRGINRSTSIQYNYPQVWQTVRLETHG